MLVSITHLHIRAFRTNFQIAASNVGRFAELQFN
jgi:hypothetical protein